MNAAAPIRICDLGGWTDTWFAGTGAVCNIAVTPVVEVQVVAVPAAERDERVELSVENYGERFVVSTASPAPERHRLLEAAIDSVGVPDDVAIEITIHSEAPAAASTGTSAAVTVGLIGALDALTPGRLGPHDVARAAHRVETDRLGLQSGIQDQLASAHGGVSFIDMRRYPEAEVTPVALPSNLAWELERRLTLVYLGRPHESSAVHRSVIERLEREGCSDVLDALRRCARDGRDALIAGDLARFGAVMTANTEAQAALHPDLVNADARAIFAIAAEHGAVGCKVNGAGGSGGSVTILAGESAASKRRMVAAIREASAAYAPIPTTLALGGLRVWEAGDQ